MTFLVSRGVQIPSMGVQERDRGQGSEGNSAAVIESVNGSDGEKTPPAPAAAAAVTAGG